MRVIDEFHKACYVLDMNQTTDVPLLKKYSGEFVERPLEDAFLHTTWLDYKIVPALTLLILGIMTIAFSFLAVFDFGISTVLLVRFFVALCLSVSGFTIYKATTYFKNYPYVLLVNQLLIPAAIYLLAFTGEIDLQYLTISTIGLTLIYYQFFSNKFNLTIVASWLMGAGCILSGYLYLGISTNVFLGLLIFLIPINVLGMAALRSINRTKRHEFLAIKNLEKANEEKEWLIQDLQTALAEVKTLEGFLPICANCHSIRNDEGFWERVEKYIQERTGAQFSHSICPDCLKELYPTIYGEKV
jgi:hypothetical protein